MKQIEASEFKTQCSKTLKQVQETKEPVLATKSGKPLVKVVPVESATDDTFGFMADKVKIVGDIESPIPGWKTAKR